METSLKHKSINLIRSIQMTVNDNSKSKSIIMLSVFCFTEINYLCPMVDSCPREPVPADSEDGVSPGELAKGLDPWDI